MSQNPITKSKPKSKLLTILAVVCLLAAVAVVSAAISLNLTAPENAANTPIDPTPKPTAAPTPTPTASPSPTPVVPTELHLSSNNTTPFYKGNTLQINGTLNQPMAGVTIFLKNNGAYLANVNATTNSNGVAVFNRTPMYAFNYTITTIPPT
jgi:hypothetical protein